MKNKIIDKDLKLFSDIKQSFQIYLNQLKILNLPNKKSNQLYFDSKENIEKILIRLKKRLKITQIIEFME